MEVTEKLTYKPLIQLKYLQNMLVPDSSQIYKPPEYEQVMLFARVLFAAAHLHCLDLQHNSICFQGTQQGIFQRFPDNMPNK